MPCTDGSNRWMDTTATAAQGRYSTSFPRRAGPYA